MAGLLKSLIGKARKQPAPEEAEALQRATEVLQFRVARMTGAAAQTHGKEAA